jgi:acetolactate synthase-1/2/3 large subunit
MSRSKELPPGRRDFFKTVVAGAATLAASAKALPAETVAERSPGAFMPLMPPVIETDPPENVEVLTEGKAGSDFMVDVIKSLGFEYVASVTGSSFRALQESVTNYGGNRNPEFLTCCHEESSVAMGQGYAKIEGKPLCVFVHASVGLQHAAMAIYNAYCDRVPVFIVMGNGLDVTTRREWNHSVQDGAAMVRDYTKWDDQPVSLQHFAESAARAYKIAMTPPMGPVMLSVDYELQENPIPEGTNPSIPKLALPSLPQGDSGAVAEAARLLVQAENPVIIVDRAVRTQAGLERLIELAETLQAPVVDAGGRMNFPTRHPLNHTRRRNAVIANADVIIGLEATDFWGALHSVHNQVHVTTHPIYKSDAKLITITTGDLSIKANYQDFYRYEGVDLAIAADPEATLPSLIEQTKRLITADRKRAFQDRGAKLASAQQQALNQAREDASYAWDASPISTARLCAEVWAQIKDEDWSLLSSREGLFGLSSWPLRLWSFDKTYQYIGSNGGGGIGQNAPSVVGGALANRKHGRLSVAFQSDGDLLFAPAVLWTAAHHRIPFLSVMHNNRAYHEETMHMQRMACRHQRGMETSKIGTLIDDPNVDFSKMAQSMGLYAEGPITDPKELGPAIRRALAVVKRGEPALLDVVTQPR